MEFFLQTLVKKGKLSQGSHLWLQRLLMSVSSIAAAYVLLDFVYLPIAVASHGLNLYNRGHDFLNTNLLIGATALCLWT